MKKRIPIIEVTLVLLVAILTAVIIMVVTGDNNGDNQVSQGGSSTNTEVGQEGDSGSNNDLSSEGIGNSEGNGAHSTEGTGDSNGDGAQSTEGTGNSEGDSSQSAEGTGDNNGNGTQSSGGTDSSNGGQSSTGGTAGDDDSATSTEKWQEGVIEYNNKNYLYNNKIKTYLIMGIDKENQDVIVEGATNGGQSDAMFLLVVDSSKKEMNVISINRNTMTYVYQYDANGNRTGTLKAQICIQHGYGDGKHLSCSRAAAAVSRLFYNIPIHGYLSLRMGSMPVLADAIGGVEVEVLNDIYYPSAGVDLKKGEVKKLTGDEVYWYLRGRSKTEFDSATDRLRRQEQFISCFLDQMKAYTGNDVSKMMDIYESVEKYIVTNIDFASLASQIVDYDHNARDMYTVPGETIMGKKFEEYHVDEEKLYEMIIDIFYKEV